MPLRRLRARDPAAFETLLAAIADVVAEFLAYQSDHGADVLQLFDTYAGALPTAADREVLLPLHRRILADLDVPTIVFARSMGGRLELLEESGADVVSLDWTVEMGQARETLDAAVQGNLDPAALFGSPEAVRERTRAVIEAAGPGTSSISGTASTHPRRVRAGVRRDREGDRPRPNGLTATFFLPAGRRTTNLSTHDR